MKRAMTAMGSIRRQQAIADWRKILAEHRTLDHPMSKRLARRAWRELQRLAKRRG